MNEFRLSRMMISSWKLQSERQSLMLPIRYLNTGSLIVEPSMRQEVRNRSGNTAIALK